MSKEYNKEANDLIHDQIFKALTRIEEQTTKTNGRVSWLERAVLFVGAFAFGLGVVEARMLLSLILWDTLYC